MNSGPDSVAAEKETQPTSDNANNLAPEAIESPKTEPAADVVAEAATTTPVVSQPAVVSILEEHTAPEPSSEPQPQRYLGGDETASAFQPTWPAWFRLFLIGAFLAVNFAALCALLLYPVASDAETPVIRCLIAQDYVSPAFSRIDFARNDAARVLGLSSVSELEGNANVFAARDVNDIQSFFETQLAGGNSDTGIAYVSAHGFGDENGAWLLPAEASDASHESGYHVDQLLSAITASTFSRTIVLLDCGRFQTNLRLNQTSNQFAAQIQKAMTAKQQEWENDPQFSGRSVLILLSTSNDQIASTSNTIEGSPFALAAAYSLAGGAKANFASDDGAVDEVITAGELARFCTETVANWSLDNRGELQRPVAFMFGDDFRVATLDESITVTGIIHSNSEAADGTIKLANAPKSETKPKPATAEAAPKQKPAEPPGSPVAAADEPKAVAAKTEPDASQVKPEPSAESLFADIAAARESNSLVRQNTADWLANHQTFVRVERLLISGQLRDAQLAWERRQENQSRKVPLPSEEAGPDFAELNAVLTLPTQRNLDALGATNGFESELLLPLAERYVENDKWIRPDEIRLAAEARQLLQSARTLDPAAFTFVRDRFTTADESRIQGEIELFDGRFDQALRQLTRANAGFRDAIDRAEQAHAEIRQAERLATSLPWLVAAIDIEHVKSQIPLKDFIRTLEQFCQKPTTSQLRRLCSNARRLEAFVRDVAMSAVSSPDRDWQLALLETPDLPKDARLALFESIRNPTDKTELRTGHRSGSQLASEPLGRPVAASLAAFLERTDNNPWSRRMRYLVSTYWAPTSREVRLRHMIEGEELATSIRATHLTWYSNRLARTHTALPVRSTEALAKAVESVRVIDPSYQPNLAERGIVLAIGQVTQEELHQSVPVSLAVTQTPADVEAATLVVQTYPPRSIAVDDKRGDGRVELPISDVIAGLNREFLVEVAKTSEATRIIASLRLPGGEVLWKSTQLNAVHETPPVARLALSWPDEGPTIGVAELLPNESLPLQLAVEKLTESVTGLTVEFAGDEVRTVNVPAKKQQRVPIVPPEDFRVPISQDSMTLRLVHNNKVIDEQTVDVTVLDPRQCFQSEVTLDATRNRAIGRVGQLHHSDVNAPVSLRFRLSDSKGKDIPLPSSQSLVLDNRKQRGRLEAALPFSVPQPYRVSIDIAGVPRAMRYALRSNDLTARPDTSSSVRFLSPDDGIRYASRDRLVVPVKLRADAAAESTEVYVGIDQNQNGRLEEHERLAGGPSWFARNSKLALAVSGKPAGLVLQSTVSDIEIPLDLSGYEGFLPLLAAVGDDVVAKRSVYLIRSAPRLDIVSPTVGAKIPAAKSIRIAIQSAPSHVQAIDKVEFGYDLNQNGKFDPNEAVAPVAADKFKANGRAIVELPTTKLRAGTVTVFTRATSNAVDTAGKPQPFIGEPTATTIDYVTVGTVSGRVKLIDGTPVSGATITIPGFAAKRTGADGSYEFKGVEPGSHTLSATASGRAGSQAVKVQPARLTNADITILVR